MTAASASARPSAAPLVMAAGLGAAVALWLVLDPSLARLLVEWLPYLARGFAMNILIAVLAMALGTLAGIALGALELSRTWLLRAPAVGYVQVFRNAPHLVLIFATTYIFPFEIVAFGHYIPFPTG